MYHRNHWSGRVCFIGHAAVPKPYVANENASDRYHRLKRFNFLSVGLNDSAGDFYILSFIIARSI